MDRNTFSSPRVLLGAFLMAAGLWATLAQFGVVPAAGNIFHYLPLMLLLIGIGRLLSGQAMRGLFFIVVGLIFLLPRLGLGISWRDLSANWPLFLIAFGVYVVLQGLMGKERRGKQSGDTVQDFGLWSTQRSTLETQAFQGGDLTAFMGGCETDLTACELDAKGAVLQVLAIWGGIVVRVPNHWSVDLEVAPVMGGAEDRTHAKQSDAPRLAIRGFVMMGGIEVRNGSADD